MATSCDLANSSRPAKRGTPGKRKKLVARLLNEADSKITLKQRSEKKRERGGVDDSQNDRGERRGEDKKQEKEKERTEASRYERGEAFGKRCAEKVSRVRCFLGESGQLQPG